MRFERSHSLADAAAALPFLKDLDSLYPGFERWYAGKVVPGLAAGGDILLLAKDAEHVVGVALGKRGADETKLRCIRVLPAYQQTGVGIRLIDRMLDELQCEKPHCTVAEEMLHTYSRAFVSRYGFALSAVDKGRYRPGKLEYAFN
jgi:GNAT superfamily N-acetyltransferase